MHGNGRVYVLLAISEQVATLLEPTVLQPVTVDMVCLECQ